MSAATDQETARREGISVLEVQKMTAAASNAAAARKVGISVSGANRGRNLTATLPGAPTIGTATAQAGRQTSVTFTAPGSTGGQPIEFYTVYSNIGGFTATGTSSPIVVTGLTTSQAYTFTVKATTAKGEGAASAASNSATTLA